MPTRCVVFLIKLKLRLTDYSDFQYDIKREDCDYLSQSSLFQFINFYFFLVVAVVVLSVS
jgi:hypothetical protein